MKKNINEYWDKYQEIYSFEEFSAVYRERELLNLVSLTDKNVIEIGCGFKPIFTVANEYKNYLAIEPGIEPFKAVSELSKNFDKVKVTNSTFEQWSETNDDFKADVIVFPGVLHEVDNAAKVLNLCANHLNPEGSIYINVPNIDSLHRKLAVSMGIIKDTYEKSSRNIELQQNYNFSINSLRDLIASLDKKAEIIELKTFFLKPFTHDQMLSMFSKGIIDQSVIDGLYNVSDQVDGLGSEIACIFKFINEK